MPSAISTILPNKVVRLVGGPYQGVYLTTRLKTWYALKHPTEDRYVGYKHIGTERLKRGRKSDPALCEQIKKHMTEEQRKYQLNEAEAEGNVYIFRADSQANGPDTALYGCMEIVKARGDRPSLFAIPAGIIT